jgi:hypothetical protein
MRNEDDEGKHWKRCLKTTFFKTKKVESLYNAQQQHTFERWKRYREIQLGWEFFSLYFLTYNGWTQQLFLVSEWEITKYFLI